MGPIADPGETRLAVMLANLRPKVRPEPYVFVALPNGVEAPGEALGWFREAEGATIILPQRDADRRAWPYGSVWAMITLEVPSSLAAVGLLATLLPPLAAAGISVNPVAALHHDHLFVPWVRRDEALRILEGLAGRSCPVDRE
jgi:hypothetical protein